MKLVATNLNYYYEMQRTVYRFIVRAVFLFTLRIVRKFFTCHAAHPQIFGKTPAKLYATTCTLRRALQSFPYYYYYYYYILIRIRRQVNVYLRIIHTHRHRHTKWVSAVLNVYASAASPTLFSYYIRASLAPR